MEWVVLDKIDMGNEWVFFGYFFFMINICLYLLLFCHIDHQIRYNSL
jgi:hypothetical protein